MLSIQALRKISRRLAGLPESISIGLLVLGLGAAADLVVHVLNASFLVFGGVDRSEAVAHALVVAGVALTLGGAVVAAVGVFRGRDEDMKGATGTPNLES